MISDLLVVKHGATFACSLASGDMRPDAIGTGLYMNDTRYLSRLELKIDGNTPELESVMDGGHEASISQVASDGTLRIRRLRIAARMLQEEIEVTNQTDDSMRPTVELTVASDMSDWFAVRGFRGVGSLPAPETIMDGSTLTFTRIGLDDVRRSVRVSTSPPADSVEELGDGMLFRWHLRLTPRASARVELVASPDEPGTPTGKAPQPIEDRRRRLDEEITSWTATCTSIVADNDDFNRLLAACLRDINLLLIPFGSENIVSAGIPRYVALFGRDSLITAAQLLVVNPEIAAHTLRVLGRHQATSDDAPRDSEPGKILHELRRGELARAGVVPFSPYYGSVDATPLFVMLAGDYWRWTGDIDTLARLQQALERALVWIDEYGDLDGDGFVEYASRSQSGLVNQGWKDHDGSVVHADGTAALPPLALVEAQAYVYAAKTRIADVFEALGRSRLATRLQQEAHDLKDAFDAAYWMSDEGTYAFALDRDKKQVRSVVSNAGHALWCGIADESKARSVAERLAAPDMFSGWGIRTLSERCPAYDPMSYHNGSVWPHDNAIIAAGMARYGLKDLSAPIVESLFEAALDADMRLPELFGGQPRTGRRFARYPTACSPQAWAAGAPFMLLEADLGLSPDVSRNRLVVDRHRLPSQVSRVELSGLKIGGERLDLGFREHAGETTFECSSTGLDIVG